MQNMGILPKSSPGRAVKPTARLLEERGQTVSCDYRWIRAREAQNKKGNEQAV
jgi:hypothetical protein